MKSFLKAAFSFTPFQIVFIFSFIFLKYLMTKYEVLKNNSTLVFIILMFFGILFVFSLWLNGFIEKKYKSFDYFRRKENKSSIEKIALLITDYGIKMPFIIGYCSFFYLITPTTTLMILALFVGIVISNSVVYFTKNQVEE